MDHLLKKRKPGNRCQRQAPNRRKRHAGNCSSTVACPIGHQRRRANRPGILRNQRNAASESRIPPPDSAGQRAITRDNRGQNGTNRDKVGTKRDKEGHDPGRRGKSGQRRGQRSEVGQPAVNRGLLPAAPEKAGEPASALRSRLFAAHYSRFTIPYSLWDGTTASTCCARCADVFCRKNIFPSL
jgi:hypothetical protein